MVLAQEEVSFVILDLLEKILFLITHEGVILVLWTHREVLKFTWRKSFYL